MGLLECTRRLQPALNTAKRHARTKRPERMLRVPEYRTSPVDPYHEHLRKRRTEDPAVPVPHVFEEVKVLAYEGCLNHLRKDINQGRADAERSHNSPRRLARMLLASPDMLKNEQQKLLDRLTAACPEMTRLAGHVRTFAVLLVPKPGNADALECGAERASISSATASCWDDLPLSYHRK